MVNIHTNHEIAPEVRQLLEQIGAAKLSDDFDGVFRLERALDNTDEVIAFCSASADTVDLYITKRGTFGCR